MAEFLGYVFGEDGDWRVVEEGEDVFVELDDWVCVVWLGPSSC